MVNMLKSGELVRLRSGGPVMTVNQRSPVSQHIECFWFDGAQLCVGRFLPDTLRIITEDNPTSKGVPNAKMS
jgi:uncharacterized protein YodC (DUF2158 family)